VSELHVDVELLKAFEAGLDPRHPERSAIPTTVLGYGEISTVLEIGDESQRELAYKRLAMFKTDAEAEAYRSLHRTYVETLRDRIGVAVVSSEVVQFTDPASGRILVYIAQRKQAPEAICHRAMQNLPPDEVQRLVRAVLRETRKVFEFNRARQNELEIGFDGQMSNWAIVNFDPTATRLPEAIDLAYFDTSSPLLRRGGVEQLDPELFLRSAPSFLVWVLRLLFLEDVMTRYYDLRNVAVDLVANFYKEQRAEWVPAVVETVNEFFADDIASGFQPLTVSEIRAYYREDAWIWRLYLAFRRADRSLHRLLGRDYPLHPASQNQAVSGPSPLASPAYPKRPRGVFVGGGRFPYNAATPFAGAYPFFWSPVSMRKRGFTTTLLILALLLLSQSAGAMPPLPSSFWGAITMNGAPIRLSAELTAYVEGVLCGQATIFYYEGATAYSITVTGDDPETPEREGGREGETVHFRLNGAPLATTTIWHGGNGFTRLDMRETSPHRATATERTALPIVINEHTQ